MYVLRRDTDNKYVGKPGAHNSYTDNLEKAQIFATKKSAEKSKCGNEMVVPVSSILKGG